MWSGILAHIITQMDALQRPIYMIKGLYWVYLNNVDSQRNLLYFILLG
jgi:hypothetical protein